MYRIEYTKSASKFIRKLPTKNQKHILSVIERARVRPYKHFMRLVGKPFYKLRAGDYRLIAHIKDSKLVIVIIDAGHRKNVYD